MEKIQSITLPVLPRCINGLKKDGTRDKRYKSTMAYRLFLIEQQCGLTNVQKGGNKKSRTLTETAIIIEAQSIKLNAKILNFGMQYYEESKK